MTEDCDTRRKRLYMRSIRRGIKEMDLILAGFADSHLGAMAGPELDLYDRLLSENDQDLYQWVSGQVAPPDRYAALVARIAEGAAGVTRPS